MNAFEKTVETEGGISNVAAKCHRSIQVVSNWRARGVPMESCPLVERSLEGRITCEQMRPDFAWVRIPDSEWPWHPAGRPLINPDKTMAGAAVCASNE